MKIEIRGAEEHNLKSVDIDFPEGLTVVTGVSGSGKSSLVFDTLYHEAHRHFTDMLAASRHDRLPAARVQAIRGLAPAVAIGQNLLNRNPASTLATASGLHPFFRILYANYGRRHCPGCGTPQVAESTDDLAQRLVAATGEVDVIVPLVRGTKGSHGRLLAYLATEFGTSAIRVDGRWRVGRRPLDWQRPHDIALRVGSLGATKKLKDVRDLLAQAASFDTGVLEVARGGEREVFSVKPVCRSCDTWFLDLQPLHFNMACRGCGGDGCDGCAGTGLFEHAAAVTWQEKRLTDLLTLTVDDLAVLVGTAELPASAKRLRAEIQKRLAALQAVGLGYVQLSRPSPTLSRGESQRTRLAVALTSRLDGMLHILDEPTVGLHPADVARIVPEFRRLPGPVIFVEHDRVAAAEADHAVDIGPGAGSRGGEILFAGTPAELWRTDSLTGRFFSLRAKVELPEARPAPERFITLEGVHANNLQHVDVAIAQGRLNVVTGVSGSGKTTLVEDVLVPSLRDRSPTGCHRVSAFDMRPVMVDQSPIGKNPRSNPATYTKLADVIRDGFAAATDLSPSHFSFNRPEGACEHCQGMGAIEIAMRYLPSTWVPCAECEGRRFSAAVLERAATLGEVRLNIADVLALSVDEAREIIQRWDALTDARVKRATRILTALSDIGLGYLPLGQPSPSLSGGEAQRVKLARHLAGKPKREDIIVLDEPTTGLHASDVNGLLVILDRLIRAGTTVVVIEHHLDVIAAADWVVDLGPGAGPAGGEVIYMGPPDGLDASPASLTGRALREDAKLRPRRRTPTKGKTGNRISVRKAGSNNLHRVSVDFPKGALTVVTGVSGSGKSSLVHHVLGAEAQRRYLESLSMYERQGTREAAEAEVERIEGLGVTIPLRGDRRLHDPRTTLGATTELSAQLAVLLARLGRRSCPDCGRSLRRSSGTWTCRDCGIAERLPEPRHFIASLYGSACTTCQGLGTLRRPNPDKLITSPEKPLIAGAMHSPGFFPGGYYGKPFNGGYDMLQALAAHFGFDPATTPWQRMSKDAKDAFLFGHPEDLDVVYRSRKGRVRTRRHHVPGIYEILSQWDTGGTYTDAMACPDCGGGRLRPEFLAVELSGKNMQALSQLPLERLLVDLRRLKLPKSEDALLAPVIEKMLVNLELLTELGLGYLHLDRLTASLSAGEAQRLQLVRILAAGLAGLTVLMDEPSRGMHPVEIERLIRGLRKVVGTGNTAIVVEHDPDIILAADHIIDMGPGSGRSGGRVVASGPPGAIRDGDTHTSRALAARQGIPDRAVRDPRAWLVIEEPRENNLEGGNVRLPLGTLTGVCGVSGSGKSSLVMDILARVIAPRKHTTSVARETIEPGRHRRITGAPANCILVDQSRAGITSPTSYLGIASLLEKLYANSADAKALGLDPASFTARCEGCGGYGTRRTDMGFLPSVFTPCETCNGSGRPPTTADVRLRGLSLPELTSLTVSEALELWPDEGRLSQILQVVCDVGLGYLVLHQATRALSGGEVQRLKIARELSKARPAELYILDEPSIGLHMADVTTLVAVLDRLVANGATVIVIEHNLDILAACDWLLELGPGGGPDGGKVVGEGSPSSLARAATPTGRALRSLG